MNTVAFYDAKPYDREYFEHVAEANRLAGIFAENLLGTDEAFLTGTRI